MEIAATILPYVHIGLSAILIATILLQRTSAGLGEAFGAGGGDIGFHTRRGFERFLFQTTIVVAVFFVVSIVAALFVQ